MGEREGVGFLGGPQASLPAPRQCGDSVDPLETNPGRAWGSGTTLLLLITWVLTRRASPTTPSWGGGHRMATLQCRSHESMPSLKLSTGVW